jgi:hypothetical protein
MWLSNTFLQLSKSSLIASCAFETGYQLPFGSLCNLHAEVVQSSEPLKTDTYLIPNLLGRSSGMDFFLHGGKVLQALLSKSSALHTSTCEVPTIPHWPLPAVCDLTRYGRWSTYYVSVLKLSNVSFGGKCARMGNTLKLSFITNKTRPAGSFSSS